MPTSTRHILPNHVLGGEIGILPSVIISGFVKAEIVDVPMPEDEETPLAASTDDLPYSIVTVRVQTSKLTKRSPRGISSPIETSSPPRCHRPSMTAKKQILAKSPGRLSSSPIETSLPPRGYKLSTTPQKQIQSAGIGVL